MKRSIPMTLALVLLCAGATCQAAPPANAATKAARTPVTAVTGPAANAQPVTAASAADLAALNPQPLPPNPPDPDRARTRTLKQHAPADKKAGPVRNGIIIVGGKKPGADK